MTDHSLAARAAWLSYIGGYTQGEIAKRLNVSSAKAHRLIARAHKDGLVRVFVTGVPTECLELEEVLASRFSLDSCTVAPTIDDSESDAGSDVHTGPPAEFAAVGNAAARFLSGWIENSHSALIGVGKGRSLSAMVDELPPLKRPDVKFVSVSGSLTRNLSANPLDVVHKLVERTQGEGYFLPIPYITSSAAERKLLLEQKSVQELLCLARKADLFIIGIGAVEGDAHVRQVGMLSDEELAELEAKGAVGDVMGSFVDADGRPVDAAVNRQTLGLGLEDLKGRKVVAVVGGGSKGAAVLAALRTGVITDLIIGEAAAQTLRGLLPVNSRTSKGSNR